MQNRTSLLTHIIRTLAILVIAGVISGCANRPIVEFPMSDYQYVYNDAQLTR